MMKNITFLAIFATLLCFTAKAQNPNNLLDGFNPGFEGFSATDPCYWWNTQIDTTSGAARGAFTFTTVNPKEGARAVRVAVTAINPTQPWNVQLVQFSQFFALKQLKANNIDTQFYTLRFWARADVAGKKINALVQKGAPGYETPFEANQALTTSWVQYSYKMKVPSGDYHPAFHFGVEPGIYFLDYVEFGKTEELDAPPALDKNFMKPNNPDFEIFTATDIASNWFLQVDSSGTNTARGAITALTTGAQSGTRAIQARVTAITAANPYNVQAQHNNFYAFKKAKAVGTGDQSYTLRFWAKADVAGKKVNALVQNAGYSTVAVPANQEMTLTTAWAQYTYTFTVTADDMLRPVVHLGLQTGTYAIDNFELGKTEDIITTPPVVDKNFMKPNNPSYEIFSATELATNWFLQVDSSGTNTARGAITMITTGAQDGNRALEAKVTAITASQPWNIQAQHNPFYAFKKAKAVGTGDQSYTLRFWAKADAAGKKINALVQNAAYGTVAVPSEMNMTLTTTWARYTYTFTVSADDMLRPVVHMGLQTGTFNLDNFELGKTEDIINGINTFNVKNNVAVAPNPTTGFFELKTTEQFENISIFDISGRLVAKMAGNASNQYNVSDLAKGIYEVVAASKNTLTVAKLVKM
jgi:Secretion system C-terminal sorting domain/Carbohydrate binding domain